MIYLSHNSSLQSDEYIIPEIDGTKKIATTARNAGIDDVSPHVFRHTAAVWMAEAGVPMSEIAQYLGHSNTSVTEKVYTRYSPEHLRNAASAIEIGPHFISAGSLNLQRTS